MIDWTFVVMFVSLFLNIIFFFLWRIEHKLNKEGVDRNADHLIDIISLAEPLARKWETSEFTAAKRAIALVRDNQP